MGHESFAAAPEGVTATDELRVASCGRGEGSSAVPLAREGIAADFDSSLRRPPLSLLNSDRRFLSFSLPPPMRFPVLPSSTNSTVLLAGLAGSCCRSVPTVNAVAPVLGSTFFLLEPAARLRSSSELSGNCDDSSSSSPIRRGIPRTGANDVGRGSSSSLESSYRPRNAGRGASSSLESENRRRDVCPNFDDGAALGLAVLPKPRNPPPPPAGFA